jgi:lipopolysaccharide assembly protein A
MADRTTGTGKPDELRGAGGKAPGRAGGVWIASILSAVVLVFLLIFILQNRVPAQVTFLGWSGVLPTGVALLLASAAGVLLVAIPGTVRILQLRRAAVRGMSRDRTSVPK